ncbi:hypothetical protein HMPREF1624_02911 [Sporothrix schenckii ATCC 58251]|uniref:LysM domain-containing protein n=1 Tax=Sporothrix schenckii (strain ATCC 58251 / de Perez 2211183) TaxID=1391915 RepID=U7Q176_SPOS1|nr:hypothetical protein HMPREF1624_02911 [Sporothrix schenckii ATCC 58251]
MKSTVLLLSAGLALANAEGFFNWPNAVVTAAAGDVVAARDAADQDQANLGDTGLELKHCSGGGCKSNPTSTVTKTCKECVTVTNTVTMKIPDPTTFVKTRMCTTTMIRSRTVTKCIDHTKTDTKYCPVTKTSVQTSKYVVENGDDCESIAAVYNTTVEDLQLTNTWLNGTCNLNAGDTLCIPETATTTQLKRDVAHHHHHHHRDDEDGGMTCDGECQKKKKEHHHHHGHHHHHHKGGKKCESDRGCDEDKHHHHGHHKHHHHHHKSGKCGSEGGCDEDKHRHHHHHGGHHHERKSCGEHHECVACTVPGSCPRDGIHAACPDNYKCQEIQDTAN